MVDIEIIHVFGYEGNYENGYKSVRGIPIYRWRDYDVIDATYSDSNSQQEDMDKKDTNELMDSNNINELSNDADVLKAILMQLSSIKTSIAKINDNMHSMNNKIDNMNQRIIKIENTTNSLRRY